MAMWFGKASELKGDIKLTTSLMLMLENKSFPLDSWMIVGRSEDAKTWLDFCVENESREIGWVPTATFWRSESAHVLALTLNE